MKHLDKPSWKGLLVIGLAALFLVGCTGKIRQAEDLQEPRAFMLLDFGNHSSLLFSRPDSDRYVRYSYGDWDWYVEGQESWYRVFPVLFWPTASGLGRMEFDQVNGLHELSYLAPRVYYLEAEAEKIAALQERLDAYFDEAAQPLTHSEQRQLDFVAYPKSYWLLHQSNLKSVEWLREIGLEVSGYPLWSTWAVVDR